MGIMDDARARRGATEEALPARPARREATDRRRGALTIGARAWNRAMPAVAVRATTTIVRISATVWTVPAAARAASSGNRSRRRT